ncbi:hypothetical protein Tco_1518138 [Tanacetum coccineum]
MWWGLSWDSSQGGGCGGEVMMVMVMTMVFFLAAAAAEGGGEKGAWWSIVGDRVVVPGGCRCGGGDSPEKYGEDGEREKSNMRVWGGSDGWMVGGSVVMRMAAGGDDNEGVDDDDDDMNAGGVRVMTMVKQLACLRRGGRNARGASKVWGSG